MKNKKYIWSAIISAFLLLVGFVLPIPFYIEEPGEAFMLDEMISIDDHSSPGSGTYSMTTVGIFQATPFSALSALSSYRDLMSEEEMFAGLNTSEAYDFVQELYMQSSVNHAIQVAYDAAGASYEVVYGGVYVLEVIPESDFLNDLHVGDKIIKVDQQKISRAQQLIDYLSQKNSKEQVELLVQRGDEDFNVSGSLIELETGQTGLGIALVDHTCLQTDPSVTVDFGNIGGPSAGLLYSLYIYDQLIAENLSGDKHISGTGTINADGSVGPIGGAGKKVIAADEAGADIFFVPNEEVTEEMKNLYPDYQTNYEEALQAAADIGTDMKIVPVNHFSEAVKYLKSSQS